MHIKWWEKETLLLGAAMASVFLIFIFFFPSMFVSIDEQQYVSNAIRLQNGTIKNADPLLYCGGAVSGDNYLSNYMIGKSIPLIPFTWFPFPFIMLSGLIIHLVNTFIFSRILQQQKLDVRWTLLFLFFPAMVWGSRTLLSELWALTFLLSGIYFYCQSHPRSMFWAGLVMGLAALTRIETILITGSFALVNAWKNRHFWNKINPAWYFILGGGVAATALLSWNAWYFGNPISTQFGNPTGIFSQFPQALFGANLIVFTGALLIAYPFLLASPLRSKILRWEITLGAILTIIMFSHTTNNSVFEFFSPLTITARLRYFIPLAGLLLIPYADVLNKIIFKHHYFSSKRSILFLLILLGGIAGAATLSYYHDTHVDKREAIREIVLANIPPRSLTIGSSDDCIYFSALFSDNRKYARISDPKIDIPALIRNEKDPIYVMYLSYSNISDSNIRQKTIDNERKKMNDFIVQNRNMLREIIQIENPHKIIIYSWEKDRQ